MTRLPAHLIAPLQALGWEGDATVAPADPGAAGSELGATQETPVLVWLTQQMAAQEAHYRSLFDTHWPVFEKLLDALLGELPDPHSAALGGPSPLNMAIEARSPRLVARLLKAGAPLQGRLDQPAPALYQAVSVDAGGSVITALLAAGADPNEPTTDTGDTALMAVDHGRRPGVVDLLLEAGANPAQASVSGRTALIRAVETEAPPERLAVLVNAGAPVCPVASFAPSPLIAAARHHPFALTLLLEKGASPADVETKNSQELLHLETLGEPVDFGAPTQKTDALTALAEHGVCRCPESNAGNRPSREDALALMTRLVEAGAALDHLDAYIVACTTAERAGRWPREGIDGLSALKAWRASRALDTSLPAQPEDSRPRARL